MSRRAAVTRPWRPRRAQLVAEAVTVICPECGEVQPAFGGSEFWTHEDFAKVEGPRRCVSCDVPLIVASNLNVRFQ